MIWVKNWKQQSLPPSQTGPHPVILATPTAVKCLYSSPSKDSSGPTDLWQTAWDPTDPLKLEIQKTTQQPHSCQGDQRPDLVPYRNPQMPHWRRP